MKAITPTLAICILSVAGGVVAAIADLGGKSSAPSTYGDSPTVTIKDFQFSAALVSPGATVTVTNLDSAQHTVTADDGAFNSNIVDGGSDGSFVAPTTAGTYAIHCDVHPSMKANLVVAGS